MATYLNTTTAGNGPVEIEQFGRGMGPDAVLEGLGVSVVSGLTVRIAPGRARVGGFIWVNPSNFDMPAVDPVLVSGQNRTDSLFLRRTYDETTKVTTIVPAIESAVGSIPAPAQGAFPNVREMRLARWSVVGPTAQIQSLTNDGPGQCVGYWARDAFPLISNTDTGVPDLHPAYLPQSSRGPQPASVDGFNFAMLQPGIYSVKFSVHLGEAATAIAKANENPDVVPQPYIRLRLPDGNDSVAGFQLGLKTSKQHGRASITEQFAVNSSLAVIEPRIFQASGATQAIDFRFKLARLAG